MANRRIGGRSALSLLVALILAVGSNAAFATTYGFGPSPTTATVRTPTAQLASGTAGSSAISNGVYATVTVGSSALPLYYVPITLKNAQGSATPSPLQVQVAWTPSTYASYESVNLGNVRFCSDAACQDPLFAWLESCSSSCSPNTSTASAWVRVTASIAGGGGTLTIYMVFLDKSVQFDNNYWGEAAPLSGTYGQYDNGVNVFSIYFNGNTGTSSFTEGSSGCTLVQTTGVLYGTATINALKLSVKGTKAAMAFTSGIPAGAYIAESNLEINPISGVTTDYVGLVDSGTASSLANGVGGGQPGSAHFVYVYWTAGGHTTGASSSYSIAASTWYYADVVYPGTSAPSFTADLYSTLYTTPLATTTANANPLSSVGTFYFGLPTGNGGATGTILYYNWGRVRAYPPGGIPPSVSFGSVQQSTILTLSNSGTASWLANLVVYSTSNTARLNNLTVSFYNPYSKQVILGSVTNQNQGHQVTLGASTTISIIMDVTVNSAGTSTVTMGLKIQSVPSSGQASVYCYDVISLTVS